MAVVIKCPACGKTYRMADEKLGGRVRCKMCRHVFTAAHSRDHAPTETKNKTAPDLATGISQTGETAPFNSRTIGRFQIKQQLGTGAFGAVYRAWDPVLEREVAVKVPRHAGHDDDATPRFEREAKAAAQLQHPNIVPVYDAGVDDGRQYIASMFVLGRTLKQAIDDEKIDLRQRVEIVMKLADALHYAHQRGIVHRDVKPANVMLDDQGEPHLMDFGLAAWEQATEKLTADGTVVGTPAYLSPEQAGEPGSQVGPASDQFSLGVVLYELLGGQRPFVADDLVVLLFKIRAEDPPAMPSIDPSVPGALESICLRAMEKKPANRYADCGEFAERLRDWLAGRVIQPIEAVEASSRLRRTRKPTEPRAAAWYRQNPLAVALIGGAALLMIVALVLLPKIVGDKTKVAAPNGKGQRSTTVTDKGAKPQNPPPPLQTKLTGSVGERLYDENFRIRIPQRIEGTILRDQDFAVPVEIENRTDRKIDVSKIELVTYNEQAARILDLADSQVHSSVIQVTPAEPLNFAAKEQRSILLPSNRILPDSALIKVFHNAARWPSQFRIAGLAIPRAVPTPRRLPPNSISFHLDGLKAVEIAKEKSLEWSDDAILTVAFTVDRKVVTDPKSGLQVVVPESWLVQFFSPLKRATFNVGVDDESADTKEIADNVIDCERTISPRVSLQQAIALASENDLLCANWNGHFVEKLDDHLKNPRLQQVRLGRSRTYAWHLPYLGPDSVPIVIDAITGDRLQRSERIFSRTTLKDKSLLEGERSRVTWNMPLRNMLDRMLVGGWDCSIGRLLYNDVTLALKLGGQHHIVVGWGLTVDGMIQVIRAENDGFDVQQYPSTAAEEMGATIKSIGRTFTPEDHETARHLATIADDHLRLMPNGEHQLVKGQITCTVQRDVEVRELMLVMSTKAAAGEKVEDLNANLIFKGDRIRGGKIDVEFDTSRFDTKIDWDKGVTLRLTAFVLDGEPATCRISNVLHCQVER